jgi:ribonuclease-3
MNTENLAPLEDSLGHRFARPSLLRLALSHTSFARESIQAGSAESAGDNEQLEFLGDSVLSFVITAELVARFPQFREGTLSKLRAHLVSEKTLAEIARKLGIGAFLQLGRGEDKGGGRAKPTLLCDALEAVIAALYLDGGIEAARPFILERILHPELEHFTPEGDTRQATDYKSVLQELIQANSRRLLSYTVVAEEGPEHRKNFTVEVRLLDATAPGKAIFVRRAVAATKKKAEQDAARQILADLSTEASLTPQATGPAE